MHFLRPFNIAVLFLFWTLLVFLAPTTVYWRDSGEFLLTAYFLDIPHTPGFPTYAALANLFALLPLGPISFRIHAFSAASACIILILLTSLCQKLTGNKKGSLLFCGYLLMTSAAFLRGALTAEVYLLACAFSLGLLLLYASYRAKKEPDLRLILACAFLSGLAAGAHVSTLPLSFVGGVLVLTEWKRTKLVLIPAFLLFFTAILVFVYLPVRASTSPPLNSGSVFNTSRLEKFLTNRRDTDLRKGGMADIAGLGDTSSDTFVRGLTKDLNRLNKELPLPFLLAGFAGLLLLLFKDPRTALLIFGCGLTNYLFFKGWEADPWIPLLATTILGMWILVHTLFQKPVTALALVAALVLCCVALQTKAIVHAMQLSRFLEPVKTQRTLLSSVSTQSVLITEPSWFLTRYAQDIEGIYDDVASGYLHELLFPAYFSTLELKNATGNDLFSSLALQPKTPTTPFLQNISNLIKVTGSITFEPAEIINTPLKSLLHTLGNGLLLLKQQDRTNNFASYLKAYKSLSSRFRHIADDDIRKDSYNYLEARLAGAAQFLSIQGQNKAAASLLLRSCSPVESSSCTISTLNNAGVYLMRAQEYRDAVWLYTQLAEQSVRYKDVIDKNLETARSHLPYEPNNTVTK